MFRALAGSDSSGTLGRGREITFTEYLFCAKCSACLNLI